MSTTVDATSSVTRTLAELQETTTASNELGQDAFLQILVAQMANQDPLEPSSDSEYIAQLAQFSVLEQITELNSTFETSQAYSLVGKTVCVSSDTDDDSSSETIVGKVDGVVRDSGIDYLVIDGERYEVSEVVAVLDDETDSAAEQQILQSASMIGKNVSATLTDEEGESYTLSGIVQKISIIDGEVYAVVDDENVPLLAIEEITDASETEQETQNV